jgi:hypothetical protein
MARHDTSSGALNMPYCGMMFIRTLLVLMLGVELVAAKPAQVILLRHAEKPEDTENPHLSPQGVQRAQALVAWFTNTAEITWYGPPAALYATHPKNHGGGLRTKETLEPFAKAIRQPILSPFASADYALLAKEILTRPEYEGKTVVVCWVHTFLPDLAREFGVKSPPKTWNGEVFNRAWRIRFSAKKAKLTELKEHLLPGDSPK